ncbi:hypothetical protein Sango_2942900 [Sesamum angolense]|uniref:Reverse transcriptase domain-containing protein n=1 Tax=Sesamum angolense TaxID=2727404 RepID=A0AAE1T4E1_9LAMI|nr:hypothetical protein Sango_2942900 [Sesamum angolense]
MVQNPSPSRDRTAPPQQINTTASLPAATVRQQPPPAVFPMTTASPTNSFCRNYLLEISLCILTRHSRSPGVDQTSTLASGTLDDRGFEHTVASGIGRPLYPDAITRACTRLDFARVCVMLNVSSKLPKHVVIMMPNELGGHSTATCPESNKIEKPKVAVYVQKRPVQPPPTVSKTMAKELSVQFSTRILERSRLNRRDHQAAVKELVNEFRLNFLGLLETRVSAVNVLRVQTFLPRWSWFTDYDMPDLVTLADSISDEPWIVGGDFNTVVDMSEVCGASADIHLAMNEFRDCILGTGLIHLPVQGELFSSHNCSEGDRSLWKRLDRLLVNDAWLRLWPNSHYQCLNARTSDHSPLVLRGDTDNHMEESQALVQSVTREEIKDAFFDIAEDKAPGPDGYSSGFYKAAWPVIGEEMIKAILEFFTTGRLLKQVNTTILALIPKGLPMRCALKVDLRKAYDTVEWDFLSAVLQMFGFSGTFIGWVESVSLLLCSRLHQWEPSRFLQGFQGVKTRDPMSPFLFVLIMEVLQLMLLQLIDQNEGFSFHWWCKELGLFQLCFANDLLLFCKADVASVRVFRHGLAEFAKLSGLHANPQRVSLFSPVQHRMSGNNYLQHYISRRVTFPSSTFRLRLLASRLSISDCKPLLLKIDSRIKGWESIQLSFAGELQFNPNRCSCH